MDLSNEQGLEISFSLNGLNILVYSTGTTLTQEMVYLISTGDFETATSVELDDRFPIIDVINNDYPFYRGLKHFENMKSQRFVKTHFHYFLLPEQLREGKGKVRKTNQNIESIVPN